jgi:hypothetical protein
VVPRAGWLEIFGRRSRASPVIDGAVIEGAIELVRAPKLEVFVKIDGRRGERDVKVLGKLLVGSFPVVL